MPEPIAFGYVGYPFPEPTCCPDAYQCNGEIECARHGGFDVCCDRPEEHIPQDRDAWHDQMSCWEQNLLDEHIRKVLPSGGKLPVVVDVPVQRPTPLEYIHIAIS